jgi:hypothetical protein
MTLQQRYLELLCKSLINEVYLENDARLLYVLRPSTRATRSRVTS